MKTALKSIYSNRGEHGRLSLLKAPYNEWVERTLFNYREGLVNEEMLTVLSEMTLWKKEQDKKRGYARIKRMIDFFGAIFLLFLFSPILLLCAILIKLESKGPVFFRQLRSGRYTQPFWILKFRTMPIDLPQQVHFLRPMEKPTNAQHTTRIGRFLRDHKLDELPQLWNVVTGEMSLVGPRPLSLSDTSTTPRKFYKRFAIRPGMTGLWQALLPNNINGETKLLYDTIYVRKRCFLIDMVLLVRTLLVVTQGENSFLSRRSKRWTQKK